MNRYDFFLSHWDEEQEMYEYRCHALMVLKEEYMLPDELFYNGVERCNLYVLQDKPFVSRKRRISLLIWKYPLFMDYKRFCDELFLSWDRFMELSQRRVDELELQSVLFDAALFEHGLFKYKEKCNIDTNHVNRVSMFHEAFEEFMNTQ